MELPRIISVDDHVLEPPSLWLDRLPAQYHDRAPRVQRSVGRMDFINGALAFTEDTGPGSAPMDLWLYDDLTWAIPRGMAQVNHLEELSARSITYDEMIPACFEQTARLEAMDVNHTEASLTFPSFAALLRADLPRA